VGIPDVIFDPILARGFDFVFGPSIRRVAVRDGARPLYLTFDDGPDPRGTPRVLDLLAEFGAHATFFLVGNRARENPNLVREILARGHALGNHSPDHRYATYFSGKARLRRWIEEGAREIEAVAGVPPIGFRPPAGVRTPELVRAVRELGTPLVLWQTRFYDSVVAPTDGRMVRSLDRARPGDIVLLHDSQRESHLELFLNALRDYLKDAQTRSFTFHALERSHFHVGSDRSFVS
jgi:peptidoglycan/xylan/chitin deacetylase (PgdA/CDA1 family)